MEATYDFVIVGGGTCGLVLANRLTEDPKVNVLVLEAGANRNDDPKVKIPGLTVTMYDDPMYDWSISTVPQTEMYGKTVKHGRGKVLGGSSAINVLALVYPSKSSMDNWAELGNKGWDWKGIEPYLRKSITYNSPTTETAKALAIDEYVQETNYGTSGPIQSSFPEFYGPLSSVWAQTFKDMGHATKHDPMSGSYVGGLNTTSTVDPKTWERSHAGSAYYAPVADRPNLTVLTECVVQKLQLDQRSPDKVATTGVHVVQGGQSAFYKASREVLLCAGAIHSPQLLELSGIGNPSVLEKHGIKPIVLNKHVGENLQDHTMSGCCFEVIDGYPTTDMIRDPAVIEAAMAQYMTKKQGPLTAGFHWFATLPLLEARTEHGKTEMLKILETELAKKYKPSSPAEASQQAMIRRLLQNADEPSAFLAAGPSQAHFEAETHKELFAITDPHNYVCALVGMSHPLSRGTVHIHSAEVNDLPDVDPQYFSHPLDLEMAARHMQWVGKKLRHAKPLADYLKDGGVTLPKDFDVDTVDAAKEHVRRNTVTFNHVCGTCAMMPQELGGVVDDCLRVYGVAGLRVVDASVFPLIPQVNIQATVYAVAEKAADIIRQDYA